MIGMGTFSLQFALVLTAYTLITTFFAVQKKSSLLLALAYRSSLFTFLLINLASLILLSALINNNFNLEYVASYTSNVTPLFYRITAFWAGQSGSLLFWCLILAWFLYLTYKNDQKNPFYPITFLTLNLVLFFFLLTVVLVKSPFLVIPFRIPDGQGLNPLLQNVGMAYHPPTLYLGYVGLVVPFAYYLSLIFHKKVDRQWLKKTRKWLIIAWAFLGVGIVLGAQWAYVELGWGGYWAWDPVENASLMPWLIATAAIHSIYLQIRKGHFRIWNFILLSMTFVLSIFGTFITRSGVISSVHAFTGSELGIYFLIFILFSIFAVIIIALLNRKFFQSQQHVQSIISREGSILLNNIIFLFMTVATLIGTTYPLLTQLFTGEQLSLNISYYNQIMVPLGLIMLFLMGISPFLNWFSSGKDFSFRVFLIPLFILLALASILIIIFHFKFYPAISSGLIASILYLILVDILKGARKLSRSSDYSFLTALWALFRRSPTRYLGHLIHLGVLMMFLGFTGSAFNQELKGIVEKGIPREIGKFSVVLKETRSYRGANYDAIEAVLEVFKDKKKIGELRPEKRVYDKFRNQPRSEVSIITGPREDVYGILVTITPAEKSATVKILVNPLVLWIWIGASLITLSALFLIIFTRNDRRKG